MTDNGISTLSNFHTKLRVDVSDDNVKGAYSSLGSDWTTTGYEVTYPFVLKAKAPAEYFFVRNLFQSCCCCLSDRPTDLKPYLET
jgi:hypothetical protein